MPPPRRGGHRAATPSGTPGRALTEPLRGWVACVVVWHDACRASVLRLRVRVTVAARAPARPLTWLPMCPRFIPLSEVFVCVCVYVSACVRWEQVFVLLLASPPGCCAAALCPCARACVCSIFRVLPVRWPRIAEVVMPPQTLKAQKKASNLPLRRYAVKA